VTVLIGCISLASPCYGTTEWQSSLGAAWP
jgi:hypothetical protein